MQYFLEILRTSTPETFFPISRAVTTLTVVPAAITFKSHFLITFKIFLSRFWPFATSWWSCGKWGSVSASPVTATSSSSFSSASMSKILCAVHFFLTNHSCHFAEPAGKTKFNKVFHTWSIVLLCLFVWLKFWVLSLREFFWRLQVAEPFLKLFQWLTFRLGGCFSNQV